MHIKLVATAAVAAVAWTVGGYAFGQVAPPLRAPPAAAAVSDPTAVGSPPDPSSSFPGSPAAASPPSAVPPEGSALHTASPFDRLPPFKTHRAKRSYVIGGGVTFGISWGAALFGSLVLAGSADCSECGELALRLAIPIAGPLLAAKKDRPLGAGTWTFFSLWSALQAVGATLLVVGLVGEDLPARYSSDGRVIVGVVPLFSPQGSGLALASTF